MSYAAEVINNAGLTRRGLLLASGAVVAGGLTACGSEPAEAGDEVVGEVSPERALEILLAGNRRYRAGKSEPVNESVARRRSVAQGQHPFGIVFSCIDSRVPPELVFDRGLGDLFVIRTAGHVLDGVTLGSLEFGVAEFGCPILLVLGHEKCGAVQAAVDGGNAPGKIGTVVEGLQPALRRAGRSGDRVDNVVRANISLTVAELGKSQVLADAVSGGKLSIVGARYDLDTGKVEITDDSAARAE